MSSQHSSSKPSSSFDRLNEKIQHWIYQAGWNELRDAQEMAIPIILEGVRDVIIAAATASGKTEAAFLPILTRLLESKSPLSVLYISPLKALINDQWNRLDGLCASLEVPVTGWHGDVSASRKKKFFKDPRGCLLITPESLEGILIREGHAIKVPFGGLAFIVVDELHSFIGTERGKQLQSLLNRIESGLGRRIPRIGLSATLGDMALAGEFLRPTNGSQVEIVQSNDDKNELKVLLKGIYDSKPEADDETLSPGLIQIGESLYESLRGSNNLVFPNSRSMVEILSDQLRRLCERDRVPNEFWPHHGSLSKDIREEAEQAIKTGERPTTIVATSTLELGVDIGSVVSVAQIEPAPSIASLRQRLGRSGRRRGDPAILRAYSLEWEITPELPLPDTLRQGLVQLIAQITLLTEKWYEPPSDSGLHLSTLVQQLLSLIAQFGGVEAGRAWTLLCESGVFPGLSKEEFASLLRTLGEKQILIQDSSGLLLHGPVGDRIVNHYTFLAAFSADDEFRVVSGGRTLGTLPLSRPVDEGSFIIFAGRRWRVLSCSPEEKVIEVTPAKGGKPPRFEGMSGHIHDCVRERVRSVLASDAPCKFLDSKAAAQLAEARGSYRRLQLDRHNLLQVGHAVYLFTWKGDRINDTLCLLLNRLGLPATNEGVCCHVGASPQGVLEALRVVAGDTRMTGDQLAATIKNKIRQKWDGLLPGSLLDRDFAQSCLDVDGAVALAGNLSTNSIQKALPAS